MNEERNERSRNENTTPRREKEKEREKERKKERNVGRVVVVVSFRRSQTRSSVRVWKEDAQDVYYYLIVGVLTTQNLFLFFLPKP